MELLIIACQVENITTRRDRTWKITIGSQEMTPQQAGEIVKLNQESCFVAFKLDAFKKPERAMLENLETELEFKEKPKSQRLRAVLYRLWEKDSKGYDDFTLYYNFRMEKIIEFLKTQLD